MTDINAPSSPLAQALADEPVRPARYAWLARCLLHFVFALTALAVAIIVGGFIVQYAVPFANGLAKLTPAPAMQWSAIVVCLILASLSIAALIAEDTRIRTIALPDSASQSLLTTLLLTSCAYVAWGTLQVCQAAQDANKDLDGFQIIATILVALILLCSAIAGVVKWICLGSDLFALLQKFNARFLGLVPAGDTLNPESDADHWATSSHNPWRDAVLSRLALVFIDPESDDPHEILRKVIEAECDIALNPAVSEEAQALIDRGRKQESVAGQRHPDDAAVDAFAEAMKKKLAAARAKGRDGWNGPHCNAHELSQSLREHVEKGDPRDVANFCMFLHQRGEAIQPSTGDVSSRPHEIDSDQIAVLNILLDVSTASWALIDDAQDNGSTVSVDRDQADCLSGLFESLNELPDDQPGVTMDGPGKARWALRLIPGVVPHG